ncbi:MAG: PIN domain-containing protein [Kiritimatiellae bacterium]|jgi:predicted nucleic acid-binding protein|nr:PIN domain-containing protein [Kiritimatiellia bacterium]
MRFFDTNVLVYTQDDSDPRKRAIAIDLVTHALEVNHDGCISTQVLQEFCNTMYKKTKRTKEEIDVFLDYFRDLLRIDVTIDLVRHALAVKEEYGIQFYDALVVSAAEKLCCTEIVSEDLNPDQMYRGMAVVNPFE